MFAIQQIRKRINEQASTEKKFAALLDAAPDATVIVDKDGIIRVINQQVVNLFGYERDEIIGQSVEILVPQASRGSHGGHRNDFFSNPKVRVMGAGLELHAVKKDKSMFPVEISLSPIKTDEGWLVSASVRDITRRKTLENTLKKTNEELEAFTYSVSHDLRAPLRGIVGFTSILEEEYASQLDDEARRITGIIRANTHKMGNLVDDLLAFSRTGKQDLIKIPVDMDAMVRAVTREVLQQYPYLNVTVSQLPLPTVKADKNTIQQVWVNLISNAVKYSARRESIEITIGSQKSEEGILFFVKDNGVGFDNKYKAKLFRVFQRLHSPDEYEGTGVGLALVEKIVSRHGGRVWGEGEVNQGACFYFLLPE
ncbi:MAG: PAS domain S-box protein [Chitinophagaceae bacterium]|nr:PAS domain S-box protein [Chitinophagaceae bacterium]